MREAEFIQEPRGIHSGEKKGERRKEKKETRDGKRPRVGRGGSLGGCSQFSDAFQPLILGLHLQGKSPSSYLNQESEGWGRESEFAPLPPKAFRRILTQARHWESLKGKVMWGQWTLRGLGILSFLFDFAFLTLALKMTRYRTFSE